MDRIRVGFIGCGGNASGHIGRILEMPETEIVALCDPSQESIRRVHERHAATAALPVYTDYRELLARVEVDAIEISTPHTTHYDQIMDSLDKGAHVLTEKPMVCSVEHARAVIAKAGQVGRILMVAYQRHLMPHFRFVRNQVRCGELGQIQFISALQDQGWLRGTRGSWRQQLSLSGGGQLNDSGSHLIDIILWMTGLEPAEVQAYMESFESEV
ncbi:MAG: Gfo/Idh/MocA family oxidoreductase, partial [Gemmatimonadota bacterium]